MSIGKKMNKNPYQNTGGHYHFQSCAVIFQLNRNKHYMKFDLNDMFIVYLSLFQGIIK